MATCTKRANVSSPSHYCTQHEQQAQHASKTLAQRHTAKLPQHSGAASATSHVEPSSRIDVDSLMREQRTTMALRILLLIATGKPLALKIEHAVMPDLIGTQFAINVIVEDRDLIHLTEKSYGELVEALSGFVSHTDEDDEIMQDDKLTFRPTTNVEFTDDAGNNITVTFDKTTDSYDITSTCPQCGNDTYKSHRGTMKELMIQCYIVGREAGQHFERHRSYAQWLTQQRAEVAE